MSKLGIKKITARDRTWVRKILSLHWGSHMLVSRGKIYDSTILPGFMAFWDHKPVGLCTYHMVNDQLEITSLNSLKENMGVGSALIRALIKEAKKKKCSRIWLITTNDNLHAIGFYQKRGFNLRRLYPNAILKSRQLKPEIPHVGQNGIPIRDELEFEIAL